MGTLQTWRKAYGALKDHTKVGLAQINSDFKDVDVAIVKATNHVECPPKERHIKKIFAATSAIRPRADVAYCIHALARRLAKTHNWTVALKTLIVVHRTLREGDPTFREEFLNFQQRGRILQLSNFKDDSSPIAWDCSAWVRTYALFLEERLECFRILKYDIEAERLLKPGQGQEKGYSRTREVDSEELLEQLPALQQLLYRLIGCRPEGAAVSNYIIQYALALVLKESFKIYCAINDGIINLVDKFFEMPRHEAMKALDIYKRAGQQAGSLSDFYDICKGLELARNFQFPALKEPPQSFLATMEEYIREAPRMVSSPGETLEYPGMLQLTYKPEENSSPSEDTNVSVNEPQPLPTDNVTVSNFEVSSPPTPPNNLDAGDLLGLSVTNPDASAIEDSNALALAIIPSDTASSLDSGAVQAKDFDPTGWELALVTTPSSNMSSVNERQLYWLCEHTTILQPRNPNAIPRCVKWDLTALHSNMKSISLAKLGLNEVYGGQLMASPTEVKMYRHTKLNVEPKLEILSSAAAKKDESNEDQSKDSQRSDDRDGFSVDAMDLNDVGHDINPSCSTPNAERGIIIAQPTEPDIVEVLIKENQKAWGLVRQWEAKYKQLEESWELRARVIAALEAKLFDQSGPSNVDMDMKTCMEWKDTEIQRLTKLVINLECEKTILQDLFDDQSVHIITQVEAQKAHDSLNKHPTAALEYIISPPSRVKRIKQKVRKEHRLDEFEYPNLPGQKKGKEGAGEQSHVVQIAQDLDKQLPKKQPAKSKKLTLKDKLKVWANMNKLNKQKVQNLHKNGGDELLVWRGDLKTKDVYFDDIIHIIKEESITNNVIDAYGEILLELQGLVNPSLEDSSFIFTSTCLKIMQEYPLHKRNKLIDIHIKEYQGQRFLIFPIYDNFHWTIVVYDVKENVWRHYNSLRPKEGIHDPHIDKAQIVRDYITALVHNIGPSSLLWTNLSSQNTSETIISVDICPQQASNSVDCGPAVCYIMKAHVCHEDIVASLARYEWCQIRDSLVHLFLNHRKTVQCENL